MGLLGSGSNDMINFPADINNFFYIIHITSGQYLKNPIYGNKLAFITKEESDRMIMKICKFADSDWYNMTGHSLQKINKFLIEEVQFDEFLVVGGPRNI